MKSRMLAPSYAAPEALDDHPDVAGGKAGEGCAHVALDLVDEAFLVQLVRPLACRPCSVRATRAVITHAG